MDLGLKGKRAIVTGGSLGIGKAIARELAREGVDVAIVARTAAQLDASAKELAGETGGRVIPIAADVTSKEQVDRMVATAAAELGGIHILVNSGSPPGGTATGPIETIVDQDLLDDFNVKYMGALRCARAVIPHLKAQGWGRIINMSSIHGRVAVPNRVDYVTAKHALIGMTRCVALETAETGVTINALMPGWVLTPHAEGQIARQMAETGVSREKAVDELMKVRQPSHRPIMPADIAAFGVFLCSDAGAHISGAALPIDGTWSAGWTVLTGNKPGT
jgi:3-hydroxybutyrate dehydrogenase